MNAIVQRPSLSSLPEGEGSFTFLSAQKSEAKRRTKGIPISLAGNGNAILSHPTPAMLPAERQVSEPPPL